MFQVAGVGIFVVYLYHIFIFFFLRKLWFKGEESGHVQHVKSLRMDCDQDVLLLTVEQVGGIACHTGRNSCFFESFNFDAQAWEVTEPVLKDPALIYASDVENSDMPPAESRL